MLQEYVAGDEGQNRKVRSNDVRGVGILTGEVHCDEAHDRDEILGDGLGGAGAGFLREPSRGVSQLQGGGIGLDE